MRVTRFRDPVKGNRIGLCKDDQVIDLTSIGIDPSLGIIDLIETSYENGKKLDEFIKEKIGDKAGKIYSYNELDIEPSLNRPHLILPYEPSEIWGFGVTYIRSRIAREGETSLKGLYDKVYLAERPEIFFKSTPSRCVGPNEHICIRSDSKWTVPEPELTFIVGKNKIIAYSIGIDVTARDIEGENPLYLSQAKIYYGCSSLGPAISTSESITDPKNLNIECKIWRKNEIVFEGKTNTSKMKRSLEELFNYLRRNNPIPIGTACMTGTGIVPPDDFALKDKDIVEIHIEKIGMLRNPVKQL